MNDQSQSAGAAMPPRETGSPAAAGGVGGASSGWSSEGKQAWQSATTAAEGEFRGETAGHGTNPVAQARDIAGHQASDMAGQASAAVDEGIGRAASGLDRAADMIRERGEQMGGSGAQSSAAMVADKLDSASTYLRDKKSGQLVTDLKALVRQKPMRSLLIAAGVGFLLSKMLR